MSYFCGSPSKRQFFEYLQALSNKISLIDVGDLEILWEKGSISLDDRHFMACSRIQWEKRGICQFPIRSFPQKVSVIYPQKLIN